MHERIGCPAALAPMDTIRDWPSELQPPPLRAQDPSLHQPAMLRILKAEGRGASKKLNCQREEVLSFCE